MSEAMERTPQHGIGSGRRPPALERSGAAARASLAPKGRKPRVLGRRIAALVLAGTLGWAASPALAADGDRGDGFLVDSTTDAVDALPGNGICATAAGECTLRAAIQEANAGAGADTIVLPAGTYALSLVAPAGSPDDDSVGDLDITESLDLIGAGRLETVVDANGVVTGDRAFQISDPKAVGVVVTMTGLKIEGGRVLNQNGAAILVDAPEAGAPEAVALHLELCQVSQNWADSDAVDADGQPVGGSGGAIFSTGDLQLVRTRIQGNLATVDGGGIYSVGALSAVDGRFAGNWAQAGGAVFERGSHISTFSRSAFYQNYAATGGAVQSEAGALQLFENCSFIFNYASQVGAGINARGTADLASCTFSENYIVAKASVGGAGLNAAGGASEIGTFRLRNTILGNNKQGNYWNPPASPEPRNCGCTGVAACSPGGQFVSLGNNLEDGDTCTLSGPQDLTNTDTQTTASVVPGGEGLTVAINPRSLATDGGPVTAGACPSVDQGQRPRPVDGDGDGTATCDIGAYERQEHDPHVFFDNWEIGDLSRWSDAVAELGSSIAATQAAAYDSFGGMDATLTGTTGRAYVEDDSPDADTHVRWSFEFNANAMTMADGSRHKIFQAFQQAPSARLVTAVLRYRELGGMDLRVKVHQDDRSWVGTAWMPIPTSEWV